MSRVISYSLYEFRNVQRYRIFKQNRIISISSGLIEFWCFRLPAALGRGQVDGGHLGAWGDVPTHMHVHAHLYMYRNCKWPLTWRHPCLACLTCMCMRACMHAWDTLTHTHAHPHPHPLIWHPPQGVDPRNHLKFNNTSTYQDISIPFEDLKSVKNSPPMGGWVGGWVG